MLKDFRWTDENTATLHNCASAGLSGGAISVLLGCSRSTVLGKCHRIGVTLKPKTGGRIVYATEDQLKSLGIEAPTPVGVPRMIFDLLDPIDHFDEEPEPTIATEVLPGRALPDLERCHCHAVLGSAEEGTRYCGEPVFKGVWCKEHHTAYCRPAPVERSGRWVR